jgi:hypothetical protein
MKADFTWGVLDALLEDGRLAVEAISGASAGALNAAVMVEGWLEGGTHGSTGADRSQGMCFQRGRKTSKRHAVGTACRRRGDLCVIS